MFLVICTLLFIPCAVQSFPYSWDEKWYEGMPLDHFSYSDTRTFNLRYLINTKSWKSGGPIFFYCGNEGSIDLFANNTGFMWYLAPSFKAMVVFAEHRYYGKTMPVGGKSYSNLENLGKLSSEQALADYAVLLTYLKKNITGASNSPVIAFGGSYGGMLAAWFRIKYPHIVLGSLASSAPILQFTGYTPCWVYSSIVTRTFRNSGPGCADAIKQSWKAIRDMASNSTGRQWLNSNFHLCTNSQINKTEDAGGLIEWISGGLQYMAMIDYPYPTNFLNPVPGWPVKYACKYLNFKQKNPPAKDLLKGLYQAINVYQNFTGNKDCNKFTEDATSDLGTNGWNFQACTEMVMPMCQNGTDMFEIAPWNLTAFYSFCQDTFFGASTPKPRVNWATINYGGDRLKYASNIIFSNGDLDPWSGGGVTEQILGAPASQHIIYIKESAHHLDLREPHSNDTKYVTDARKQEKDIISGWLNPPPPPSPASCGDASLITSSSVLLLLGILACFYT